jgi:hypothetical protein
MRDERMAFFFHGSLSPLSPAVDVTTVGGVTIYDLTRPAS